MIYEHVSFAFRLVATLFFAGLTFGALGLTLLGTYETIAVWTRQEPTISLVTSYAFLQHPVWGYVVVGLLMFAIGALVTHLTHWTP